MAYEENKAYETHETYETCENNISSDIFNDIEKIGIIPVIKLSNPRDAVPLSHALLAGGLKAAEITFRTEGAAEAINLIRETAPEILLSAGTVLNERQADDAIAAGAKYIVMPGFDKELVRHCIQKGVLAIPGCSTPTDFHAAYRMGLKLVKFFPAEQLGGPSMLKAISAPFPMFKLMPTGGISLKNLKSYLSLPCVSACGGSYMVKPELISEGRWDEISELCKESLAIVKEVQ